MKNSTYFIMMDEKRESESLEIALSKLKKKIARLENDLAESQIFTEKLFDRFNEMNNIYMDSWTADIIRLRVLASLDDLRAEAKEELKNANI